MLNFSLPSSMAKTAKALDTKLARYAEQSLRKEAIKANELDSDVNMWAEQRHLKNLQVQREHELTIAATMKNMKALDEADTALVAAFRDTMNKEA